MVSKKAPKKTPRKTAKKKAPAKKKVTRKQAKAPVSKPDNLRAKTAKEAQGSAAHEELQREFDKRNAELKDAQRWAARKLKLEHLIFANAVLQGSNLVSAYYQAYPNSEASYEAVKVHASKLNSREDVSTYMGLMKESRLLATAYDREWKRFTLIEITERCMVLSPMVARGEAVKGLLEFDPANAVRAIAEMNKMDGDYADQNLNVTHESHADRVRRLANKQV